MNEHFAPATGSINRRNDSEMRESVNRIQQMLFDPDAGNSLYAHLLEQIMSVCPCDMGTIVEASDQDSGNVSCISMSRKGDVLEQVASSSHINVNLVDIS